MAVRKISIALESKVAESAANAARAAGVSLSAWLTRAAEHELALERGLRAAAEWEREHGAFSEVEIAHADAVLDRLLVPAGRERKRKRSAARGRDHL